MTAGGGTRVPVARVSDVAPGHSLAVVVAGRSLAVCNAEGRFFALENRCSHDDGPLGEGELQGVEIECPRHGARFSLETGRPLCLPAVMPVAVFPVTVEDGRIYVTVPE